MSLDSDWIPLVKWLNSGEATPELTSEERKAKAEAVTAEAAAAAEKARAAGYTALCKELVEAGHYLAKGNVTATMKLMHRSYSVTEHNAIKAKLIEQAAIVAAALKEGAPAAEATPPAEGTENPAGAGAPELP